MSVKEDERWYQMEQDQRYEEEQQRREDAYLERAHWTAEEQRMDEYEAQLEAWTEARKTTLFPDVENPNE